MNRALALFAVGFGLVAAATAQAASEPAARAVQPYVDLQAIGFPAVVQGRLVNYIFVQLRMNIAPGVDASRIQQGEPMLRDTLVHAATRTPFNPPDNAVKLDQARLKAEVMREAAAQFGAGKITAVVVRSETPQRRSGVPGAAGLGVAPAPRE